MSRAWHRRGFSLIELLIAVSIFMILIMIAGPMYADFMGNAQIRNASESLLSGIRLAQAEAVRRNTQVAFVLDPANGWQVSGPDLEGNVQTIQSYSFKEGASRTKVTAGGATTLTYDGLGRILKPNPDASAAIDHIDVTITGMTSPRNLRIAVGLIGGSASGVKLCDPASASTEPQACP